MNEQLFKVTELPMAEMEKIGIVSEGKLLIEKEDLQALLSGRRTDMLRLENLFGEGLNIAAIDAKLSLARTEVGKIELRLHPINKEPDYPSYLTDVEAEKLVNGETQSLSLEIDETKPAKKEVLVEYDPETKEFVISDLKKLLVPDMVNEEYLSPEQREKYRKGKEVELSDGTVFKYTSVDREPIRSNRIALVVSLLLDGGLSYLLIEGLKALSGKRETNIHSNAFSAGYYKAIEEMEQQNGKKPDVSMLLKNDEARKTGYTR